MNAVTSYMLPECLCQSQVRPAQRQFCDLSWALESLPWIDQLAAGSIPVIQHSDEAQQVSG